MNMRLTLTRQEEKATIKAQVLSIQLPADSAVQIKVVWTQQVSQWINERMKEGAMLILTSTHPSGYNVVWHCVIRDVTIEWRAGQLSQGTLNLWTKWRSHGT